MRTMNGKIQDRIKIFEDICPLEPGEKNVLVQWLTQHHFFTAPASTKYHGAYDGGLFDHSMTVYENLKTICNQMPVQMDEISMFIMAVLHDVCKCDLYEHGPEGWRHRDNVLLTGHGEKSVMMLATLDIPLTDEEVACIRYHMGAFCDSKEWSAYTNAIHVFPSVLWLHTADMMAAHIDMI